MEVFGSTAGRGGLLQVAGLCQVAGSLQSTLQDYQQQLFNKPAASEEAVSSLEALLAEAHLASAGPSEAGPSEQEATKQRIRHSVRQVLTSAADEAMALPEVPARSTPQLSAQARGSLRRLFGTAELEEVVCHANGSGNDEAGAVFRASGFVRGAITGGIDELSTQALAPAVRGSGFAKDAVAYGMDVDHASHLQSTLQG